VFDIIVVGAGLSGLKAASVLENAGKRVLVIEASNRVGGRIKTEKKEGFLLDRGFQVLMNSYPEVKATFNLKELKLQKFMPGALVMKDDGSKVIVADPRRAFKHILKTLFSNAFDYIDLFSVMNLLRGLKIKSVQEIFAQEEMSTKEALKKYGFSETIIQNFFIPFYRGVFLENNLSTSRKIFDFTFKMFAEGEACLPKNGMEVLPQKLKEQLKTTVFQMDSRVVEIEGQTVKIENEHYFEAPVILLATEETGLTRLYKHQAKYDGQSVTQLYFTTNIAPVKQSIIGINASEHPFISNFCVPSKISKNYAPKGKHLISVSVNGLLGISEEELVEKARFELRKWFGLHVDYWKFLESFKIRYALPEQKSVSHHYTEANFKLRNGLWCCGDHLLDASINGALLSGRLAAEHILNNMKSN